MTGNLLFIFPVCPLPLAGYPDKLPIAVIPDEFNRLSALLVLIAVLGIQVPDNGTGFHFRAVGTSLQVPVPEATQLYFAFRNADVSSS